MEQSPIYAASQDPQEIERSLFWGQRSGSQNRSLVRKGEGREREACQGAQELNVIHATTDPTQQLPNIHDIIIMPFVPILGMTSSHVRPEIRLSEGVTTSLALRTASLR